MMSIQFYLRNVYYEDLEVGDEKRQIIKTKAEAESVAKKDEVAVGYIIIFKGVGNDTGKIITACHLNEAVYFVK